ncbi:glucose-6-phosphate dehydrogenase [Desulfoscipio geothermicus]|uniref:Glucose-6-phosphate 1-dehydrogenase n=1 Tax=Desulfoscipio geothermicus DSM 3669 TaxID=1121426 RepID=A0A1I6CNQ0_9FIRM|nr:glucose-6-phosphate dehydrogenase [Desulfoscipio geothermicus]SFQ94793.1 glucose-6-phosphate 1-dehydrogenase [Desulfoscipio geothermicus DSM 3669]
MKKSSLISNVENVFNYNIDAADPCVMVIFGGTGDLTHRKLMPALYNLQHEKRLPKHFAVVAVGRRNKDHETYRYEVYDSIKNYARFKLHEHTWSELRRRIYYQKFDFNNDIGYIRLNTFLQKLDEQYRTRGNRIYYLAVAPEYFAVIVEKLYLHGMARNSGSWQRLVIEKPFGRDLDSARQLNEKITAVFDESNIYRIDHYLGKEMLQNIMVIRFANMLFEPVWNNRFIDNIQILSCEKVGVGSRGGYYEQAGALRDMLQNHMLQLLTLTAIEPPAGLDTKSIRDEKVKVLRSLEQFTPELVEQNVVRGQYGPGIVDNEEVPGYRQEERVSPTSNTETFIALKAHIDNLRWAGVPFYIRTGKRMPVKTTEIIIQFKPLPKILYAREYGHLQPNILIIKIQPREGVFFQFNAKKPGTECNIVPVQMDYCQNCREGVNSPAAYERLLFDVMRGESTLFARWDEVEYAWKFVDNIAAAWQTRQPGFPNYPAGSWGPREAAALLAGDNRNRLYKGDIRT